MMKRLDHSAFTSDVCQYILKVPLVVRIARCFASMSIRKSPDELSFTRTDARMLSGEKFAAVASRLLE